MKIQYSYKDRLYDDIRDIVYNNKLEIDFEYITQEYIPYQVFITGRTFFKDVTINIDTPYVSTDNSTVELPDFTKSIEEYLYSRGFDGKDFIAAVSGGIDSSLMALETKANTIYSGYYNDPEYSEIPFSKEVAKVLHSKHYTYELTEDDFLDNLEEFMRVVCSPIAGYGGVMEYVTLKKALEDNKNTKFVLFGNGGDEIFFGYPFNYTVKDIYEYGTMEPKYMSNFAPQKRYIVDKALNILLVSSLNRSTQKEMYNSYSTFELISNLNMIKSMKSKVLHININIILPSLLHLNNQICKACGVTSLNPLSNKIFIEHADKLNDPISDIPKEYLRNARKDMPESIVNNYIKRGFPMPLNDWDNAKGYVGEMYNSFFKRIGDNIEKIPYVGLNRYAWGISQSELFLREFAHD